MEIQEVIETRYNMYAFLSRMYLEEPPIEMARDIAEGRFPIPEPLGTFNEELKEGLRMLKEFIDTAEKKEKKLLDQLIWEYTNLFIGPSERIVLPYESSYIETAEKTLPKVIRMYKQAGVSKSAQVGEREDHIALELEYMGYLCKKELESLKTGEKGYKYIEFQKEFLTSHLQKWAPKFCDDILKHQKANFYKGIAMMTKGFLAFDKTLMDEIGEYLG